MSPEGPIFKRCQIFWSLWLTNYACAFNIIIIIIIIIIILFERAADSTAFKYIDCFNGGRFLSEEQCLDMLYMGNLGFNSHGFFEKATPRQVSQFFLKKKPFYWIKLRIKLLKANCILGSLAQWEVQFKIKLKTDLFENFSCKLMVI